MNNFKDNLNSSLKFEITKSIDDELKTIEENDNGPTFGGGHVIHIYSNSNKTNGSYLYLGNTYKHPQYTYGTNEAKSFLTGSFKFQLSEIGVYQKVLN